VPVIAVFTKYDELVDRELLALYDCPIDGLKEEDFPKHAKKNAGVAFAKECIEPFNEVVAGQVPYRVVSSKSRLIALPLFSPSWFLTLFIISSAGIRGHACRFDPTHV